MRRVGPGPPSQQGSADCMASAAMRRYVVHLPPTMLTRLPHSMSAALARHSRGRPRAAIKYRGRRPAKLASTRLARQPISPSSRRAVARMNSISRSLALRIERRVLALLVGRPEQDGAVPRHREQHPAVGGAGNQQRGIARQHVARHDHVRPWLGRTTRPRRRSAISRMPSSHTPAALNTQRVRSRSASPVSTSSRVHRVDAAGTAPQPGAAHVVDRHAPSGKGGLHQGDREAGIVELGVPVGHAAAQPLGATLGHARVRVSSRERKRVGPRPQASRRACHRARDRGRRTGPSHQS